MKKIFTTWLVLATLLSASALDKEDYYLAGSYQYNGITLPHRQLTLNADLPGQPLLVVQLHGGSARGNDNVAQLNASAVDSVENYLREHQAKAIFVLPQCGADRVWNESRNSYSTTMTDVVTQWLQEYIPSNNVDASRVYITGYSAGGSGTWRMVNDNQDMFASALIAAAKPLMVTAANIRHTPVYAVAGSNDQLMDYSAIKSFVESLQALDAEALYYQLNGRDHLGTCDQAFTHARLDWLLSHNYVLPQPSVTSICDVNHDGAVDVSDVNMVINAMLGKAK